MKKNIKKVQKIEEVITYEAYDGTVFKTEEQCKKYEETARAVIEKAFYSLMIHERPFPECGIFEDFGYGSEEFEMAVIDIKDVNDLEIANRYFAFHQGTNPRLIGAEYIGKRVLVNMGYVYDDFKDVNPRPITEKELVEMFTKDVHRYFTTEAEREVDA